MQAIVSYTLAILLLMGTSAHGSEENGSRQDPIECIEAEPTVEDHPADPAFYLGTIGALVFFGLQGFNQYQQFMKFTSR